jgi:hypothetical protein
MSNKPAISRTLLGLLIACLLLLSDPAVGQSTAFSYQGKLTDAGNPANGNYDLEFSLFDTADVGTGTQQGPVLVHNPVATSGGVFTVILDFGSVFAAGDRYLQIRVRPVGGPAYVTLSPRQRITASPYAIETINAKFLGGLPASRYVSSAVNGNVGIGTNIPTLGKLEVRGGPGVGIYGHSTANVGVFGKSTQYEGVRGEASDINHGAVVGSHEGNGIGVFGTSTGIGVEGVSAGGNGVVGGSTSGTGVYGVTETGRGVLGKSTSGSGVYGESSVASLAAAAVFGKGLSSGSIGVIGESNINDAVGVYGATTSATGWGVFARNWAGGTAIYSWGNAAQSRDKGGFVKAMIYVNGDASIARCYNGITNSSTGNCGFSVFTTIQSSQTVYLVNFGFQVNDRFLSLAQRDAFPHSINVSSTFYYVDANTVRVKVFTTNADFPTSDTVDFILVVY